MNFESITFIIFLFFVPEIVQGQYIPMVEEGKIWIYLNHFDEDHPVPVSGHAIRFEGDTTINSLDYKKVFKHNLKGTHNCPYPPCFEFKIPYESEGKFMVALMREDTLQKKIFNIPLISLESFCDTTEYLLFDFSLGIGDTLNDCIYEFIGAGNDSHSYGIVDSIKVTEKFGKNRTIFYTYGFPLWGYLPIHGEVLIMEGVGLEHYGIFHERLSYWVDFCEGGMESCDLILSNSVIERKKEVNIFPNPTNGNLQISTGDVGLRSIRIYSMTGLFKTEVINANEIDLSTLETGVYMLELILENGERIVKNVIKEN